MEEQAPLAAGMMIRIIDVFRVSAEQGPRRFLLKLEVFQVLNVAASFDRLSPTADSIVLPAH